MKRCVCLLVISHPETSADSCERWSFFRCRFHRQVLEKYMLLLSQDHRGHTCKHWPALPSLIPSQSRFSAICFSAKRDNHSQKLIDSYKNSKSGGDEIIWYPVPIGSTDDNWHDDLRCASNWAPERSLASTWQWCKACEVWTRWLTWARSFPHWGRARPWTSLPLLPSAPLFRV